jgi:hypothetical protein
VIAELLGHANLDNVRVYTRRVTTSCVARSTVPPEPETADTSPERPSAVPLDWRTDDARAD